MINTNGAPRRARWAVMWVYSDGKRTKLARKDFKDDYVSAERLYFKARQAGKRAATLACVNMGFPPPVELRPYTKVKRGRDKRTRKIRTVTVEIHPLKELNLTGKVWCPYCRTLRSFRLQKVFVERGIRVADPRWICPICGVSQRDHYVRYWNPTAAAHMESSLSVTRRSRTTKKPTRRRRRVR